MTRRATHLVLLAVALFTAGVPALAAGPTPSASPPGIVTPRATGSERAIELVRATDPRFADLPTFDDIKYWMSRTFSTSPVFAGSWIDVLDSAQQLGDPFDAYAWLDLGGRIVEVMLVADCPPDALDAIEQDMDVDPCGWRHTWRFLVTPEGDVSLVFEAGSPDDGRMGTWTPLPTRAP